MERILDWADSVYWWLRHHLLATAGIVGAIVLALVALATLRGDDEPEIPQNAVAVIGNAPITEKQLTHWQDIYTKGVAGSQAQGGAKPDPAMARRAAFELLAGSTFITQEAERRDIAVPDAEVKKSVDEYFTQNGATTPQARTQVMQQIGVSEEDLRYQQKVSLLSAKLRERVAKAVPQPSAEAIRKSYEQDPQRWAKPTERDLRAVISADEATAKKAKAALEGGDSFAAVTKQYSIDASLGEGGGAIKDLKPGSNAAVIERAFFSAPVGELQGPLNVDGGWIVFRVQSSKALPEKTLQQATPAIRKELLTAEQTKATSKFVDDLRSHWKARTRCTSKVTSPEFCTRA